MTQRNLIITTVILCPVVIGILTWEGFNHSEPSPPLLSSRDFLNREEVDKQLPSPPSAPKAASPLSNFIADESEKKSPAGDRLREIAASGSLEDWQAFLDSASAQGTKETLLELIGESGRPEASGFLKECLGAEIQSIRRAAIRGLAGTGRPADALLLRDIVLVPSIPIEETTEAALALGASKAANAAGFLVEVYAKNGPEELQQCILIAMAQRPFQESEPFLRQILLNPSEKPSRKKEILESLGQFDTVKETFFIPFMDSPEVDVRRGAYQGLGKLAESQMGYLLLNQLQKEKDELARADLYEALCTKDGVNRILLNQVASAETDSLVRLIAANAVASSLRGAPESDPVAGAFCRQWVPKLTESALHGNHEERVQAVLALMSAQSLPAPRIALQRISAETDAPNLRDLIGRAVEQNERNAKTAQ